MGENDKHNSRRSVHNGGTRTNGKNQREHRKKSHNLTAERRGKARARAAYVPKATSEAWRGTPSGRGVCELLLLLSV